MLVHNNFRLFARRAKTIAYEIHFRLHDGQIILRSSLQHKTRAQRRKIGNAGDVKKNVLREHSSKAGENFLRLPALALKINNVRLHENGAAITENRHRLCGKSQIRVLVYVQSEAFRRGLEEVSVPRRALRVQLEILHAPVMQNDDFDVLSAHVHDHVRIFIELQR